MEQARELFAESKRNPVSFDKDLLNHFLNDPPKNPKSAEASEKARKKGNDAFLQQQKHDAQTHKIIFDHYCESVALAPVDSEALALAYGNRSYFLLHIHKYEDCIKDIDRALKILTASDALKAKLLCRKAECSKRLGSSNFSSILDNAQSYVDKTDGQYRIRLLQMVEAAKALDVEKINKVEVDNHKEIINELPITDDYLSRVSIEYNTKYGRHLVAARDYEPGDIIFAEEIYASASYKGLSSSLSSCDYCSNQTWSSIPCDYCNWSVYCSESCKEKAWNDFHDIDCSVISRLREYPEFFWEKIITVIRVLITAIKETGSIANLKKELESVDHCKDAALKGFFKNGQLVLNSIRNVYTLVTDDLCHDINKTADMAIVPILLICLTKHSVLKNNYNEKQLEDLFINEDIEFLGPLLIKIFAVLQRNIFQMQPTDQQARLDIKPSQIVHFDERMALTSLYSLLNHSCSPTAACCCTEANKVFVYALQPIEKNSQIFVSYCGFFDSATRAQRHKDLGFTCDCQACIENWPSNLADEQHIKKLVEEMASKEIGAESDIFKGKFDNKNLFEIMKLLLKGRLMDIKKKHIKKLSSLITWGYSNWRKSSQWLWIMIYMLEYVVTYTYSVKSLIFDECE